ncbi:hypothetical protein ABW16_21385 [Mycolicibacter heraklionensis]|uniref:Uncharacterized protein n=2 Tax=Mycolicibacter heraklionensis TaxID=512402 RepID=A0ABR5F9Z0_9MYCO|nr:hypothetical protein ABW16_21385 [Mycolicibacter heraklionensis]
MFDKLSRLFGLHPALGLHDLDLPDEPVSWPPNLKDRPAAVCGEASAAGHPNEIRELLETADDILRDELHEITLQMAAIVKGTNDIVQAASKVIDRINALDPTPVGLVRTKRR